jgi:ABC-2 type transport system permease protein
MRTILYLLQKEFLQIFRNKMMLPLIFIYPLVQLIVLVNTASMDMKNIRITVVDNDISSISRIIIQKLDASPFFIMQPLAASKQDAFDKLEHSQTDVLLFIKQNTEKTVENEKIAAVQVIPDAINSQKGQLAYVYINNVLAEVSKWLQAKKGDITSQKQIKVSSIYWFNPELKDVYYMLPGILVILVTIIGMFLSAMNLVREKEIGTTEQINVTPIHKSQFIAGKLIPFWIIGMFEMAFGLFIGKLIYQIPINGSLFVLFSFAALYLVAVLGLGLLISTFTDTQQQVMFLNFFFVLVFTLMSGVFTSVDNMPLWGQYFDLINPLYYFMNVTRMVLLKGAGFHDLIFEFSSMAIYAVIVVPLAVFNYKKTS